MVAIFAAATALLTPDFVESFDPELLASTFVKLEKEFGVKFNKASSSFSIIGHWDAVRKAHTSLQNLLSSSTYNMSHFNTEATECLTDNHTDSDDENRDYVFVADKENDHKVVVQGNPKRGRYAGPLKQSLVPEPLFFVQYQDQAFSSPNSLNLDSVIEDFTKTFTDKTVCKEDIKKVFEKNTEQMGRPLNKALPKCATFPFAKVLETEKETDCTRISSSSTSCEENTSNATNAILTPVMSLLPSVPQTCLTVQCSSSTMDIDKIREHANSDETDKKLQTEHQISNLNIFDPNIINTFTSDMEYSQAHSASNVNIKLTDTCDWIEPLSVTMPVLEADVSSMLEAKVANDNNMFNAFVESSKILSTDNSISGIHHSYRIEESILLQEKEVESCQKTSISADAKSDQKQDCPVIDSVSDYLSTFTVVKKEPSDLDIFGKFAHNQCNGIFNISNGNSVTPKVDRKHNCGITINDATCNSVVTTGNHHTAGKLFLNTAQDFSNVCCNEISNTSVNAAADGQTNSLQMNVTDRQESGHIASVKTGAESHGILTNNTSPTQVPELRTHTETGRHSKRSKALQNKNKFGKKTKEITKQVTEQFTKKEAKNKMIIAKNILSTETAVFDKPTKNDTTTSKLKDHADIKLHKSNKKQYKNYASNALETLVKATPQKKQKDQNKPLVFQCNLCNYQGHRKKRLTEHMGRVHGVLTENCRGTQEQTCFRCDQCDKIFVFGKDLSRHKKIVHHGQSYECKMCSKTYKSKYVYDKHLETHKQGYVQPMYKCQICEREFTTKFSLSSHIKSEHLGVKKTYMCPICGKSFSQIRSYRQHANVHAGIRPYVCEICNKSFTYDKSLKEHRYMHDNIRRFQCTVCEKSFRQRTCLIMHMNVHKETKDHICSSCGKGFAQKQSLVRHERIHTGDKPYSCKLCHKCFSDYAVIRKHMLMSHKKEKDAWREDVVTKPKEMSDHYVKGGPGYMPRIVNTNRPKQNENASVSSSNSLSADQTLPDQLSSNNQQSPAHSSEKFVSSLNNKDTYQRDDDFNGLLVIQTTGISAHLQQPLSDYYSLSAAYSQELEPRATQIIKSEEMETNLPSSNAPTLNRIVATGSSLDSYYSVSLRH